jgi:hypothetical protein
MPRTKYLTEIAKLLSVTVLELMGADSPGGPPEPVAPAQSPEPLFETAVFIRKLTRAGSLYDADVDQSAESKLEKVGVAARLFTGSKPPWASVYATLPVGVAGSPAGSIAAQVKSALFEVRLATDDPSPKLVVLGRAIFSKPLELGEAMTCGVRVGAIIIPTSDPDTLIATVLAKA